MKIKVETGINMTTDETVNSGKMGVTKENNGKRDIKICVFDLDGTLTNTLETIAYYGNNALEKFGLLPIETEKYKMMLGAGAKELVISMLRENGCENNKRIFEQVGGEYSKTYDEDFMFQTVVYDGIMELLQELKQRGVKVGVLSNKPHHLTVKVLKTLFKEGTFDICYGEREGVPLKPSPEGLLGLLAEMDIAPENCMYIGDTKIDMKTGKRANAYTVGVEWGFRDREELEAYNADAVVAKPTDILDLI